MRNKIIALMLTVVLVLCLSGCSGTFEGSKDYTKRTGGKLQPTMMQDLYYDTNTKIVYILFNECAGFFRVRLYVSLLCAEWNALCLQRRNQ